MSKAIGLLVIDDRRFNHYWYPAGYYVEEQRISAGDKNRWSVRDSISPFSAKRTGKILARQGGVQEQWGCTTRLVTTDIYQCVRHPYHLAVGVFMTSLGLLIGYLCTFLVITVVQWTWIIVFLLQVEEKELEAKFGDEYRHYREQVPMLFGKP